MKRKIDETDLKILEKLDENVRAGSKQIGKELKIPRQVVDYRIKRMESNGTIIDYRMLANLTKLGFPFYYRLHCKFTSISPDEKEDIFSYLLTHNRAVWVVESDGRYDLFAGFATHHSFDFQDILFEFLTKFSNLILEYDFVRVLELVVPGRDFTGKRRIRKIKGSITGRFEPEKLKDIDKKIINELALNGRQTALQVAQKIDEPAEKVNYHLKQIMKKELLFSNIQFGYQEFNFELYKTLFYLKKPIRARIEELKKFVRTYPRIWDISETAGKWQLELDIESHGHDDYYKIMDKIMEKFADIVSHYDTLFIRKERKFLFTVFN